ncbi:MAG: hypothetical protein GMKNLPBB_02178 [Myxococcota bacterium]|nr:hypothetical protein [Myxococcota bacterium]
MQSNSTPVQIMVLFAMVLFAACDASSVIPAAPDGAIRRDTGASVETDTGTPVPADTGATDQGGPTDTAPAPGEDAEEPADGGEEADGELIVRRDGSIPDSGKADAGRDAGSADTGPRDSGTADAGRDAGLSDSGSTDASRDGGAADAGVKDAGPADSGPSDSGAKDSGPSDSGPTDISPTDSGLTDAAPGDAGKDASVTDSGGDGGSCVQPEPLAAWVPANTKGPPGETMSACLTRVRNQGPTTDNRLPENQEYVLTTFGGPGDEQPVACGGPIADATWYYAANKQRFACKARVRLTNDKRDKCVVVSVVDTGPNICVEEAAKKAIWDVSPLASKALYNITSAGWSQKKIVYGAPVEANTPLGPCDHTGAGVQRQAGVAGGSCTRAADCGAGGACLTAAQGYPDGMCTQSCTDACPDKPGANALTSCVKFDDGSSQCAARCDFSLYAAGCRAGYGCYKRTHAKTGSSVRVCMPNLCK